MKLAEQLNQTFICILIPSNHPDRERIGALYNITKGFGSLFIGSDKTLIHIFRQSSTRSEDYRKQIDIALTKAGESLRLSELEKEYKNGNRSLGFLELLLQKKKTLNLSTELLLDEYISLLPEDSLSSPRTLTFLSRMAPILNSKADRVMRRNQVNFNRAWYTMPLQERISINNQVVHKSLNKAIDEKNEVFALNVANFSRAVYTSNFEVAAKTYEMNMLEFYRQTNDTNKYFMKAIGYFDRYFMSVSADSIKRTDSLNLARMLMNAPRKDTIIDGKGLVSRAMVSYSPIAQKFMSELNNGAWTFFTMTNNPYLLSIATQWAKRSLEFMESPETLDTYAHLLYKQGQKDFAIETEQKAIDMRKKRGFPITEYQKDLDIMKKGGSFVSKPS